MTGTFSKSRILDALLRTYLSDVALDTKEFAGGRRSAVRSIAAILGIYPDLNKAADRYKEIQVSGIPIVEWRQPAKDEKFEHMQFALATVICDGQKRVHHVYYSVFDYQWRLTINGVKVEVLAISAPIKPWGDDDATEPS